MKEVVTIDVVASRQWRIKAQEEILRQEKQSQDFYLHDSISWLKVSDEEHDDELERLSDKRQKGTCEWVFRNALFQSWKDDVHGEPILWVKGIPGAGGCRDDVDGVLADLEIGKTILSTYMIKRLKEEDEKSFTTAYHICNSYTTGKNLLAEILRSFTLQFLRDNLELAPYIFENYANKGLAPSIVRMRKLIPELLATIPSIRIIVDGLDEYPEPDQRIILSELVGLSKISSGQCKILFSNREGATISKILAGKSTINLRDNSAEVNKDIEAYVHIHPEIVKFRAPFGDHLIDELEHKIVKKADGMYLFSLLYCR